MPCCECCCPDGQKCCPQQGEAGVCCKPANCCGESCCLDTQICCAGSCCSEGLVCCGGVCCAPQQCVNNQCVSACGCFPNSIRATVNFAVTSLNFIFPPDIVPDCVHPDEVIPEYSGTFILPLVEVNAGWRYYYADEKYEVNVVIGCGINSSIASYRYRKYCVVDPVPACPLAWTAGNASLSSVFGGLLNIDVMKLCQFSQSSSFAFGTVLGGWRLQSRTFLQCNNVETAAWQANGNGVFSVNLDPP